MLARTSMRTARQLQSRENTTASSAIPSRNNIAMSLLPSQITAPLKIAPAQRATVMMAKALSTGSHFRRLRIATTSATAVIARCQTTKGFLKIPSISISGWRTI